MITKPTVLILGAGASKPYGFPAAEELVADVCRLVRDVTTADFSILGAASRKPPKDITEFHDALDGSDAESVDSWLEQDENKPFRDIGKAAIALSLLRREKGEHVVAPWEKNWYKILWRRLTKDATFQTFQDNKLRIVTFNYDRSLEQYLFAKMTRFYSTKPDDDCAAKLAESIPIVHVYGSLGSLPWQKGSGADSTPYDLTHYLHRTHPGQSATDRDHLIQLAVREAMSKIELIPAKSETPAKTKEFEEARQWIEKWARGLYYLGFGYHRMNMERLGIDSLQTPVRIMGTTLDLDVEELQYLRRLDWSSKRIADPQGKIWDTSSRWEVAFPSVDNCVFLRKHVNFNL